MPKNLPARRRGAHLVETPALPLDHPIAGALAALTKAVGLWEAVEPLLTDFLPILKTEVAVGSQASKYFSRKSGKEVSRNEWVREVASDLISFLEKLSRVSTNLTKVVDEAARLRDMLTGGEEQREDIAGLGDQDLIDILVETVLARGLWKLVIQRAKQRRIPLDGVIDVEVLSAEKA